MRKIFLISFLSLFSYANAQVGHGDFSKLTFTEAFESLFTNFSTYYPFTEWKAIDWQSLHNEFAPQIAAAQSSKNTSAYKLALRRFIHRFPDGHVRIRGEFQELYSKEIGGGFGLTLIELNDGSIVVNRILSGGPAEQAGIKIGAVVSKLNGLSINEALQKTEIIWEGKPPGTLEATHLAQIRRLIRAPISTQINITFSNPGYDTVTKSLTAFNDEMETWDLTQYTKFNTNGSANFTADDILKTVEYKILPSGYGYLKNRILVEFDSQGNPLSTYNNIYDTIKKAINLFNNAKVPGVIIDIRDNPGGFDKLAALFSSFFYDHTELYEHASFYNPQSKRFEVIGSFTIYLESQASYYNGPVICLVNTGTSSSAEGVAMAIKRLPRGHVLGIYGTHGSFGLTSGETLMPADIAISYPLGRSLDKDFNIQIDADSTKNGGITPDIRVPLTQENMKSMFVDSKDVELNYAIEYLNSLTAVVDNQNLQTKKVHLFANYPNPFNSSTIIKYSIPKTSNVTIKIFNLIGMEIETLLNSKKEPGEYSITWSPKDLPSGIYFYRLQTESFNETKNMLIIK